MNSDCNIFSVFVKDSSLENIVCLQPYRFTPVLMFLLNIIVLRLDTVPFLEKTLFLWKRLSEIFPPAVSRSDGQSSWGWAKMKPRFWNSMWCPVRVRAPWLGLALAIDFFNKKAVWFCLAGLWMGCRCCSSRCVPCSSPQTWTGAPPHKPWRTWTHCSTPFASLGWRTTWRTSGTGRGARQHFLCAC